jgi:HK97 family phage prohead protease
MEKIFNLTSTFKSEAQDDGSVMIRGMASTTEFDRAGDSISADAWTKGGLNNFEKNPIILFNHDYSRPIGRAKKVTATNDGLHLEAKISKSAGDVAELVKDGVLGAFSVGFRVKDADYVEETDGLRIKDAELFEVSVVSVPCNQAATFSLAKSFDSKTEYEDFKKTFTNSDGAQVQKEIQMSEETNQPVDLEAFAKKVAEETAAKIAMKQAEQKAADEAVQKEVEEKATADAEAKSRQEEEVKSAVVTAVESGTERLLKDVEAQIAQKDAEMSDVLKQHEADLKEKAEEIEKMRDSKRVFENRGRGDVTKFGKDFLSAHILGKITRKGWDTSYAKDILQKAGVTYDATTAAGIDVSVSQAFEEEVRLEQKVAPLFREIQVASGATVLPIAPDTENANWNATGLETTANLLEEKSATDNNYNVNRVLLQAFRLVSGTFISNDTDEQVVISVLPIITSALARAHAKAIDSAIMVGNSSFAGIVGGAGTDGGGSFLALDSVKVADKDASVTNGDDSITGANLLSIRSEMGKYGVNPADVAYIVPIDQYYELIGDAAFSDVSEVGSDTAMKLVGAVGSMYGSPVIASDALASQLAETGAITTSAACAVNVRNYVIPRLKGVSIETDYEVAGQRTAIVAAQSLGFNELVAGDGSGNEPSVRIEYA